MGRRCEGWEPCFSACPHSRLGEACCTEIMSSWQSSKIPDRKNPFMSARSRWHAQVSMERASDASTVLTPASTHPPTTSLLRLVSNHPPASRFPLPAPAHFLDATSLRPRAELARESSNRASNPQPERAASAQDAVAISFPWSVVLSCSPLALVANSSPYQAPSW